MSTVRFVHKIEISAHVTVDEFRRIVIAAEEKSEYALRTTPDYTRIRFFERIDVVRSDLEKAVLHARSLL